MNPENRQELLTALRLQRHDQDGKIHGVMMLECSSTSCSVGEIRVHVHERPGGKVMQPKISCIRCGTELEFVSLD
jgi:hypothetical protein